MQMQYKVFKLSSKDDKYDSCTTANIKIPGRDVLPNGLLGSRVCGVEAAAAAASD
jgi:hypothetical protein